MTQKLILCGKMFDDVFTYIKVDLLSCNLRMRKFLQSIFTDIMFRPNFDRSAEVVRSMGGKVVTSTEASTCWSNYWRCYIFKVLSIGSVVPIIRKPRLSTKKSYSFQRSIIFVHSLINIYTSYKLHSVIFPFPYFHFTYAEKIQSLMNKKKLDVWK